jgi:thiosulfate reductase cytochrome b subunit
MRITHSYLARFSHWLFAISVLVLGASGLQIFRAFPSFSAKLPAPYELTAPPGLGGWLGGALSWHFTFAWFFAIAVFLYFVDLARGGWRRLWLSGEDVRGIWPMARHYFLRGPKPPLTDLYNPLQKVAYLSMAGTLALALVTGLILAQPVQFGWFVGVPAAWQAVRLLHFGCLCAFAGFFPGHLVMVAMAGRPAMSAILIGRSGEPANPPTLAHASETPSAS